MRGEQAAKKKKPLAPCTPTLKKFTRKEERDGPAVAGGVRKLCVVTPSVEALQRLTISLSGVAGAGGYAARRRVLVLGFVSRV
jgi:hypothetical protein